MLALLSVQLFQGRLMAQEESQELVAQIGASGLALPRFVSLRSGRVNVRVGPDRATHGVAWTYTRQGLPVEILEEFDNWRRIRDSDGDGGWVDQAFLSGKRTVMPAPWLANSTLNLRRRPIETAKLVAEIEPTVIGEVRSCDGKWCELVIKAQCDQIEQLEEAAPPLGQSLSNMSFLNLGECSKNYRGFAYQTDLWGVYPDEVF